MSASYTGVKQELMVATHGYLERSGSKPHSGHVANSLVRGYLDLEDFTVQNVEGFIIYHHHQV